jgi:Glycosyl transferase family 2
MLVRYLDEIGPDDDATLVLVGAPIDEVEALVGGRPHTPDVLCILDGTPRVGHVLRYGESPRAIVDALLARPRVSVVVPCYDQARYLPEAVESVLAQTFRSFEIVVVDDGSPDDTAHVARRLQRAHPEARIRLVRKRNGGLSSARNAGIAFAKGELILPLDADDSIQPTFLERCVAALDAHPHFSIAYGAQQNFGADDTFHPHHAYNFAAQVLTNTIGVVSLFRRSAWEDVGGYAETLDSYEDWDFWIGCGERGHHAMHVPSAVFNYRVRPGSMYAQAIERDQRLKAQILVRHPRIYTHEQRIWAACVLAGDPDALAVPNVVGRMPVFSGRPGQTGELAQAS